MNGLTDRGLWALLENNKCARITAYGLVNDHQLAYNALKAIALKGEYYLVLEAVENKRDAVDASFNIFVNHDKIAVLFEKKLSYTYNECCAILDIVNLSKELIPEYENVTAIN